MTPNREEEMRWRAHARATRASADQTKDIVAKRLMVEAAERYDTLADRFRAGKDPESD